MRACLPSVHNNRIDLLDDAFSCFVHRPGSVDPGVTPSTIVTLDLATAGNYDRLLLFNTLNYALNRGYLRQLRVSSRGFSFKPIPSGSSKHRVYLHSLGLSCACGEFMVRCNAATSGASRRPLIMRLPVYI